MSKARNLSDFISDATVDSTEIADLSVTHAKLHTDMNLSSKTLTFAANQISGNSVDGGVISNFASTGIDDNASATAVTILSDGNVGIGVSSPSEPLHVAGGAVRIGNTNIRHDGSGGSWDMKFETYSGGYFERMRISSVGTVLVGKTSEGTDTDGIELNRNDVIVATRNNDAPLILNRRTSDGDITVFRKDNAAVGSIGTASNFMTIGSGDVGLRFHATNNVIFPHDMSANNTPNGTIALGTTGSRFSSLWLSGTGNAAHFTANGGGSAGVDTRLVAANTGNGGTNRGVAIGLYPSGLSNSVEAIKLIGYQNTAASTANNAAFAIQVANTSGTQIERMRIDSSGSVGIGSTNPIGSAQKLYIEHPAGLQTSLPTVKIKRANNVGGGSAIPEIALDVSVPSTYNNATEVYGIKTYAAHNLTGTGCFGIYSEVEKGNSHNHHAGFFRGGHSDTNGIGIPKVIYIDQTTNVGVSNSGYSIGCMIKQDDYVKNEFMRWQTDYSGSWTMNALRIYRNGSQIGGITTTTSSTSYNTSSDYRLKENITDVTDGITRVKQLAPKRFNFIAEPDKFVDGFIAHEAQAVVPEAVTGTQDALDAEGNPDYQGIDQSKLVPLLTAALQEAIAKIEILETEMTSAKARIAALEE